MPNKDVAIWPLYSCVDRDVMVQLVKYQWDNFGTKLDKMTSPPVVGHSFELEPVEEIDILMRQKSSVLRK